MKRRAGKNPVVSQVYQTTPKIVLLGDACNGKSTFFNRVKELKNDDYSFSDHKRYKATSNFDYQRFGIKTSEGSLSIDLWDTAGQEDNIGGKLRDAYIKGADGVLIFYDVSNRVTKENVEYWINVIKSVQPGIPIAVVGNKLDLYEDIQQHETIKFRNSQLESMYGCKKINNFLISIKENRHLNFKSAGFFSFGSSEASKERGCFIGLEYVLNQIHRKDSIKIEY